MKILSLSLLLIAAPAFAGGGEFQIGLGKTLNNYTASREDAKVDDASLYPGMFVQASAIWKDSIRSADLRVAWTYVMESDFGTEQFVTASLVGGNKVKYGAGLIAGYTQSYERWQKGYAPPDPIGARECTFCGVTAELGYEFERIGVRAEYWRTDFNIWPGHNGAAIVAYGRF